MQQSSPRTSYFKTSTPNSNINGDSRKRHTSSHGFPQCTTILWDKRCVGTETESSFSYFRDISLSVVERSLRIACSSALHHFKSSKNPLLRGLFLGSLSSHDSEDEVKIVVNRFDSGVHLNNSSSTSSWPIPSSKLPDDVVIPVLMINRSAVNDVTGLTDGIISESVKSIEESLKNSSETMSILKLFKCFCVCKYTDQFGELCFELNWNLIAPSVSFRLRPVNPVSVIPTALARNLSGPLNIAALQSGAKHGFLTMDQTRKLILLLESDPKITNLPLVGVWISGVMSSCDLSVWASLTRYHRSNRLTNKQANASHGFLAMCYMSTEKNPSFFDCTEISQPNFYKVFQAQEEVNLFKESSSKCDSTFIYFPLSITEVTHMHQVIEIALNTINSTVDRSREPHEISSMVSSSPPEEPAPCPQFAPSPNFSPQLIANESVPEVSLWEPQTVVPSTINKSDLDQDLGFFSKGSSDHDSSTEKTQVFPSRQMLKNVVDPLERIESSTNLTKSFNTNNKRSCDLNDENSSSVNYERVNRKNSTSSQSNSIAATSECPSCRSHKVEMDANLQKQKRQLEMLQNQIQTLLRAQNINIPQHINLTVTTRSAQTSPNQSTYLSETSSSHHLQTASSNSNELASAKFDDDETLMSLDPNSVPLQEDTASHDNVIISHVCIPSFVDSEFNSSTNESENGVSTTFLGDKDDYSVVGNGGADVDCVEANCLNCSGIQFKNNKPLAPRVVHKQDPLQNLNQQIAKALQINSSPQTENKVLQMQQKRDIHSSNFSNNHQYSFLEASRYKDDRLEVDLSMEANAIAMKYHQYQLPTSYNTSSHFDMPMSSTKTVMFDHNSIAFTSRLNNEARLGEQRWTSVDKSLQSNNISFATEKYLKKYGIILNGTQEWNPQTEQRLLHLPTVHDYQNLEAGSRDDTFRSGTLDANSDVCSGINHSNESVNLEPSHQHSSSTRRPHNRPLESECSQENYEYYTGDNNDYDDDDNEDEDDFNILDIDKLKSLPKLL